MALQLYLIRHGRTEWNEKGLLQGWGDSPLTEQGISAAKLRARLYTTSRFPLVIQAN